MSGTNGACAGTTRVKQFQQANRTYVRFVQLKLYERNEQNERNEIAKQSNVANEMSAVSFVNEVSI